jgi:phospholipid-binding lipoprotein MlaA
MPCRFFSAVCRALRRRHVVSGASALALQALGACATPPLADDPEAAAQFAAVNDPMEPTNRALYQVNAAPAQTLLGPLATSYRRAVPAPARDGIHNALRNASSPVDFANHLLQGKPCRAGDTLLRLVINSTFGLGGLIDVAKRMGISARQTDFGITLGVWGVPSGPYLYVPLLSASNLRDLAGSGSDLAADPWSWVASGNVLDGADWGRLGMVVVDTGERWLDRVQEINRTSLDPYVTYRSMYRQYRVRAVERARDADDGVVCGDAP